MALIDGFYRRGVSVVYWILSIAGNSPTRLEITGGLSLGKLTAITGFSTSRANIDVPILEVSDVPQIAGPRSLGDASITFPEPLTGLDTIRNALPEGQAGYVLLMPKGDVAGKRCEKWPAKVKDVNDNWDLGNAAATFTVAFSLTEAPYKTGVIPA